MHPASSIILFTTLSGAGYGLLAWVALLGPWEMLRIGPLTAVSCIAVALVLVTSGLLSSAWHLGRPERAWRAFSQWRSSWLSREGILAVLTYAPACLLALLWVLGASRAVLALLGVLCAAFAGVTVGCTAMIYRSLKPIRSWNNAWVVPVFLGLSAMTGLLWLLAIVGVTASPPAALIVAAIVLMLGVGGLKLGYWQWVDTGPARSTVGSATGLGHDRPIRVLELPHTQENYLQKEMGYVVARRHAGKLRRIAFVLAFIVPALLLSATLVAGGSGVALAGVLGLLSAMAGVLVERWLFFAEARHTVTLYYGAART
jgi:sulfite dehydrogenase (quinone) subunit SoeC